MPKIVRNESGVLVRRVEGTEADALVKQLLAGQGGWQLGNLADLDDAADAGTSSLQRQLAAFRQGQGLPADDGVGLPGQLPDDGQDDVPF